MKSLLNAFRSILAVLKYTKANAKKYAIFEQRDTRVSQGTSNSR